MQAEPLVSIIVNTTGKRLNILERLLQSLAEQSFRNFDVIVACETNRDSIYTLCRKYGLKCKVIQTGFWNRCRTANVAIRASKGKYVALLEDDLVLDRSWLENMMKALMRLSESGVVCVYSNLINIFGSESLAYKTHGRLFKKFIEYVNMLRVHNSIKRKRITVFSLSFICRKDVLFKAGLFDPIPEEPIVGEDYDLAIRINKLGYRVTIVKEAIAYHYSQHYNRRIDFIRKGKFSLWEELTANEVYMFAKHIDIFGIATLFHVLFKIIFEPLNIAIRLKLRPHKLFKVFLYTFRGTITGLVRGVLMSSHTRMLRRCDKSQNRSLLVEQT